MPSTSPPGSLPGQDGSATDGWTIGVEQEFLLVDPWSREPVPRSAVVAASTDPGNDLDVQLELAQGQIEVATGVCDAPAQLGTQLREARRRLSHAAHAHGCRLVAVGAAPLGAAGPPPGSDQPRYYRIAAEHGALVEGQAVCGCHIHIGLSDREVAIEVSNRLRPWLPVLLALSANSPVRHGIDTGYASWRYLVWSRWPISGPPPFFDSVAEYDQLTAALITSGAVIDEGMVYWDIRPSPHQPTIELRVPDIPITVHEVELLAELTLALVNTAVEDAARGVPPPRPPDALLRAACWRAARDGLRGQGVSLSDGGLVPATDLVDDLMAHVRPALERRGRHATVDKQLAWLRTQGCGADRQRQILAASGDPRRLVDFLAEQTELEC